MNPEDIDIAPLSQAIAYSNTPAHSFTNLSTTSFKTPSPTLTILGEKPTIVTDKHAIDLDDLAETVETLKERLLILTPQFEQHERYPALKTAYDNYKLIERMIQEGR